MPAHVLLLALAVTKMVGGFTVWLLNTTNKTVILQLVGDGPPAHGIVV